MKQAHAGAFMLHLRLSLSSLRFILFAFAVN